MSRTLAIYETTNGRLYGLDPSNATGVPIPSFRPVTAVPPAGSLVGEGVLNTLTNASFIWDGTQWVPLIPPAILTAPTDADVFADNLSAAGTYKFSQESGNLFVRFNQNGANVWRQVGLRIFADPAAMLAAIGMAEGSTCYVMSQNTFWAFVNGAWRITSTLVDIEANITSLSPALYQGAVAVANDTGKVFFSDGGQWIGSPFREYPTEADLLAAVPNPGTMAVAIDTGLVYYFSDIVGWIAVNKNSLPTGATDPAIGNSTLGDLFLNTADGLVKVFNGTAWQVMAVTQLGQLADVDLRTPPADKETLVFDATSNTFKAGKGGVLTGAEPALADRFSGMLWWHNGRLFMWVATATAWVET